MTPTAAVQVDETGAPPPFEAEVDPDQSDEQILENQEAAAP